MYELSFSTHPVALLAQVALVAQASIVCLLVLVNLPPQTIIGLLGRVSIVCVWLAVTINLFIDLPDNLDLWLNSFALFLIVAHISKCLLLTPAIKRYSSQPIKSYALVLLFGVLHHEPWQMQHEYE